MHHLEDASHLPTMQYGSRPAKLCISAVLSKQLQFEIQRYKRHPIAYIENDATGCYDRIVNPLVLLFLLKLGVPEPVVRLFAETWQYTEHRIKTMYGVSEVSYQNTFEYFLFRPGQGSTIGPLLWLICFLLIVHSFSKVTPSVKLKSVTGKINFSSKGNSFVDDTGLGCNMAYPSTADSSIIQRSPKQIILNLKSLAQQWERLLYSTGGALNLQKCFWFIMHWTWKDGTPILATEKTLPATLQLTSGSSVETPVTIPRIEPTTTYRTLGVHITPTGSNLGAYQFMLDIVADYAQALARVHLSKEEAITSYVQHLLPKLRFQMPALSLTKESCDKLLSVIFKAVLPRMHINRNTARSIIHDPIILGGMAIPHLDTAQGIDKLHLCLGHLRLQDDIGSLIQIDQSYVQLISGSEKFIFNQDYKHFAWIEWGWVTSLWRFVSTTNLSFNFPTMWLPSPTRHGDIFLMDYFISQ